MKCYVTPQLEFVKWQLDVVTLSYTPTYDATNDEDVFTPGGNFWN